MGWVDPDLTNRVTSRTTGRPILNFRRIFGFLFTTRYHRMPANPTSFRKQDIFLGPGRSLGVDPGCHGDPGALGPN